ncbi:MAG: branched-chain amino acid transport system substrate-binding protein [Betaproteobacteria bacterium]|jgi:branched-chain amino acid transport system substrate-binding protein|nr:branched-chain amino acid transport system substrate-binding protein [Betaproteobacteria bacterium]
MKIKSFAALLAVSLTFVTGAHGADRVKVGLITTLSGPNAAIGSDIRDAFQLAVKLNGGKLGGLPAEVIVGDDQFKPDVGRQLAEKNLKVDKVNFLTGIVFSNIMLASVPLAFENKTIYVSPNAAPSPMAGKDCNPYLFVASWPNDAYHEAAGQHATNRGYKNTYLIAPNYQAGKDSLTGFKRYYKGNVVAEVYTQLGQLDYAAELAQVRAAKPDALYIFLPGGMGVNFIKQFVAAGLSKDIPLLVPGFGDDQDIIRPVGDATLGLFDTAHWAIDLDNAANRKFVAAFEKEFKRLPTVYASQAYDSALLIDAAVRDTKGKIEDVEAVRKAMKAAKFESVRGAFKFNRNQMPIQNYYLRVVSKDSQGRLYNKVLGTVFKDHGDAYVQDCKMK